MNTDKMLQDVLVLARKAGMQILAIYNAGGGEPQQKADNSPLTTADVASHHTIVEGLEYLTPEWPILSEESAADDYEVRKHWRHFWLIDPLDGTKEFLKHNGEFTVNIALIEDGIPVMGVVYAPALDISYFAARGKGAYQQSGNSIRVPIQAATQQIHEPLTIVGSRSHSDARQNDLVAHLGGGEFKSMGSSLKLCMVANGSAHLYPRLGPTMEWDTAAAHSIALEAGSLVCDFSGIPLRYNKKDLHNPPFVVLSAANGELLQKIKTWEKDTKKE